MVDFCRDDWIRTSDLYVPNVAHYRAVLHPVLSHPVLGHIRKAPKLIIFQIRF
jgi:hypothetical protein